MPDLKSLVLAIELATRQRDEMVKAVGKAQRNMQFVQNQMAQLEGYAADTDARWTGSATGMRAAEIVRYHYQFMERLQHAMGLQAGTIGNTQRQLEAAHQALLQAESRLSGLNTILKTRQAALQKKQKRREQQETDEFAAQQYIRTRSTSTTGDSHGN